MSVFKKSFKIGDTVRVVTIGSLYSSHNFGTTLEALGMNWDRNRSPNMSVNYTVVMDELDGTNLSNAYVISNNNTKKVYIMGELGLELILRRQYAPSGKLIKP